MELDPFFDCNWESESQPRWHAKNHTLDVGFDSDDGEGLEGMEYIWSCMSWRSDTPCLELERTLHDMRNDEEACHFGFSVKGGDVEISLSATEKDTLILSSSTLADASRWFRVSLSGDWIHQKTVGTALRDGKIVYMKRYELEYDEMHLSFLVGKNSITPKAIRRRSIMEQLDRPGEDWLAVTDDERLLQRMWPNPYIDDQRDMSTLQEATTIIAYRLGFAYICGFPLQMNRSYEDYHSPCFATLTLLRLIQWFDFYEVCLEKAAPRLIQFIMKSRVRLEIQRYPTTYMRIAHLLRSSEILEATMTLTALHITLGHPPCVPGADAMLVNWFYKFEHWLAKECHSIKYELLAIHHIRNDAVGRLAMDIWHSWLGFTFVVAESPYAALAHIACGEETAGTLIEKWRSRFDEFEGQWSTTSWTDHSEFTAPPRYVNYVGIPPEDPWRHNRWQCGSRQAPASILGNLWSSNSHHTQESIKYLSGHCKYCPSCWYCEDHYEHVPLFQKLWRNFKRQDLVVKTIKAFNKTPQLDEPDLLCALDELLAEDKSTVCLRSAEHNDPATVGNGAVHFSLDFNAFIWSHGLSWEWELPTSQTPLARLMERWSQ